MHAQQFGIFSVLFNLISYYCVLGGGYEIKHISEFL